MFSVSSISILSLSSTIETIDFRYFNIDRNFNELSSLSAYNGTKYVKYNSLDNISDITINNDSLIFLTENKSLSGFINNCKSLSTIKIGYDGLDTYNKYYFCPEQDISNVDVNIANSFTILNNNLLISPYKSSLHYNIIPLKSSMEKNYEYNFDSINKQISSRKYTGIYFGNNQNNGYNNIYLQYQSNKIPLIFKSDIFSSFYIPDKLPSISLNNTGFYNNGAIAGNSPCNSDIILYDRFNYGNFTNHGFPTNSFNGVPLCTWLSASNILCNSNAVWMERWYDPNLVSQGAAFITQKNILSSTLNDIVDIPSNLSLRPKNHYSYLHYGSERNTTFINNLSSNLVCYFDNWSNQISDKINNIKGFVVGQFSDKIFNELLLDGTFHVHIPPNDKFFIKNDMTVSSWIYQDIWSCGIDTQYFGNFSNNEGYGLFYNTSANPELLTFPTTSGFIYGFNYKGIKVFEKSINTTTGVSASRIDYVSTDLFGARWVYDSINNKIYKLETDDLLRNVITLPINSNIIKMQINSQNELYVFNTQNKTISGFDINGKFSYGPFFTSTFNTFEIDKNDNIDLDLADILLVDNNNDNVKALGINLYKNNNLFYHVGSKIQAFNVDSNNNYWIVYKNNHLLKMDCKGNFLFDKVLSVPFTSENSIALSFIKEIKNGCDFDIVWIVFNNNKYILKVDINGNIIKRININDVVNLKKCGDFSLNVVGDFSGFDSRRKFYNYSDGTQITSLNPAITLKVNLVCGLNSKIIQLHSPAKNLTDWNHISFTYEISNGNTILTLYINGVIKSKYSLSGIYFINYGTKVSPFIIGGNSGKLGATNVEVSLNNEDYFIGKFDDLRIYDRKLNCFELYALARNLHYNNWQDMTYYLTTPSTTYMEEIQSYSLNRYHGSKSNKYNIKIKNLDISDVYTQQVIINSITNVIKKLTPANTDLNEIIFE